MILRHLVPVGLSRARAALSSGFVRFCTVGGIGTAVNLAVMAILIQGAGVRDWRASALSTVVASVNNYSLNNIWTFRGRTRSGIRFFTGYLVFLAVSSGSLLVTTSVYGGLTVGVRAVVGPSELVPLPIWLLLAFQLVGILSGACVNYLLNNAITWGAATHRWPSGSR